MGRNDSSLGSWKNQFRQDFYLADGCDLIRAASECRTIFTSRWSLIETHYHLFFKPSGIPKAPSASVDFGICGAGSLTDFFSIWSTKSVTFSRPGPKLWQGVGVQRLEIQHIPRFFHPQEIAQTLWKFSGRSQSLDPIDPLICWRIGFHVFMASKLWGYGATAWWRRSPEPSAGEGLVF